jgi:hypothetical protein
VTFHIRLCAGFKFPVVELGDGIRNLIAGAGHYFNAGFLQHLEGLRPTVACNEDIDVMVNDGLAGLNSGSLGHLRFLLNRFNGCFPGLISINSASSS